MPITSLTFYHGISGLPEPTNSLNTAYGSYTLTAQTTGVNNSAFGYSAGQNITTGHENTVVGVNSGQSITTGGNNVLIGVNTGYTIAPAATNNVAIGDLAMLRSTLATGSVAVGHLSMGGVGTVANGDVAVGAGSLFASSGANNTGVGYQAGYTVTTGTANTFIGFMAGATSPGAVSYSIGIGYGASPQASNVCVIGGAAGSGTAVHVGIGTGDSIPAAALDVHDNVPLLITGTNVGAQSTSGGGFMATYADSGAIMATGNRLGGHLIGGATGATHTLFQSSGITSYATENWVAATAYGGDLRFETTLNGAAVRTERMRFGPAGEIGLSGANYGTAGQVLTSNGTGAAPTWQTPGTAAYSGFKNVVINGCCRIAQRGTNSTLPTANTATYGGADRIYGMHSSASAWSLAQTADTFSMSTSKFIQGLTLTTAAASTATLGQRIESFTAKELSGKTVTISCKVRHDYGANALMQFTVYKANAADNFAAETLVGSAVAVSVATATVQTLTYTLTLGATDGDNGLDIQLVASIPGAITTKTLYMGDFQVEVGGAVTAFEVRPVALENALCQRYYYAANNRTLGVILSASDGYSPVLSFPVTMRTTPTLVTGATFTVSGGSAGTPALRNQVGSVPTADAVMFYNSANNWTVNSLLSVSAAFNAEL